MRLVRTVGFGLMIVGGILIIAWAIEPFRAVWPWLLQLPLPIRIGVVLAAIGLAVLLASLVTERIGEREADKRLLDDF